MDISLQEIDQHLNNRNIFEYESILKGQLDKTSEKIEYLKLLQSRLINRLKSLEYIRNLPELDKINIEEFQARKVLRLDIPTHDQYDFEVPLLNFETLGDLPPSLIVGDQGFIVELTRYDIRSAEEFIGMYMIADDLQYETHVLYKELPAGKWLTVYFKGDHSDALRYYDKLLDFSIEHHLVLGNYALE